MDIHREAVAFAGMKDKRAVTEQWFTFRAGLDRVAALGSLKDVEVLESYMARKSSFTGAHEGNRFVLRIRESSRDKAAVAAITKTIQDAGGVPNFFGPQRFGGHFRPMTHLVGKAIVEGDLEEAVRLYVGHPMTTEHEEAQRARAIYDETRDPAKAHDAYPPVLDPERAILRRLMAKPGDWRNAIQAHPENLLQLFVHAWQSLLFNEAVSRRVAAGLGLNRVHVGDRVMGVDDEGTKTHIVTPTNQARIQSQVDLGRAVVTAMLPGLTAPLAEGAMGQIEQDVLDDWDVDLADFRVRELPEAASAGRRRGILQPVRGLDVAWSPSTPAGPDDPVLSFRLGKGSYATVVLREYMKAGVEDY